jgi:hypothetical protein
MGKPQQLSHCQLIAPRHPTGMCGGAHISTQCPSHHAPHCRQRNNLHTQGHAHTHAHTHTHNPSRYGAYKVKTRIVHAKTPCCQLSAQSADSLSPSAAPFATSSGSRRLDTPLVRCQHSHHGPPAARVVRQPPVRTPARCVGGVKQHTHTHTASSQQSVHLLGCVRVHLDDAMRLGHV